MSDKFSYLTLLRPYGVLVYTTQVDSAFRAR